MERVRPAAPIAPWLGGKKALHPVIIDRIDRIPHKAYIEPFVGMGGVFLRRRFRPKLEVANDLNGEIVNLFRIVQRHLPQLLAFGGQVRGVFGVAPEHAPRFSLSRMEPILDAAHERLEAVVFESLDWADLIPRYDTAATLFYLDPPYYGGETDYGPGMFTRADFQRMADVLAGIDGAFILSINDLPETRAIFGAFHLSEHRLKYTISGGGATDAAELIISNREVRVGLL